MRAIFARLLRWLCLYPAPTDGLDAVAAAMGRNLADPAMCAWLDTPHPRADGATPLELVQHGWNADAVALADADGFGFRGAQ